jgi:hypothetical protein
MSIIHIYANTEVCGQIVSRALNVHNIKNFSIHQDENEFLGTDENSKKIAVIHHPYPFYMVVEEVLENQIKRLLSHCEKIIMLESEVHTNSVAFLQKIKHPKIICFTCGYIHDMETHKWMDWFDTSSGFYKKNPHILEQLRPYDVKPKFFDVLLGIPRLHRTELYKQITDNHLEDQMILTMRKDNQPLLVDSKSDEWIWEEDGLELIDPDIRWTVSNVRYHGQQMCLSQVIPINVYNQSAYTVIAETTFDNHFNFYTEKTVKPILAERLFIALAGVNFLSNLRKFGFKTFHGIIDESYAEERKLFIRVPMIIEQMKYLISQPQEKILEQIKPITEHNKKIMLDTKWLRDFQENLIKEIIN